MPSTNALISILGYVGYVNDKKEINKKLTLIEFSLSVIRKDKNNEQITDWWNCVAAGSTANYVEKYIAKGDLINVHGNIYLNSFKTKDGIEKTVPKIFTTGLYLAKKK